MRGGKEALRLAHNQEIVGANPTRAPKFRFSLDAIGGPLCKASVAVLHLQQPEPQPTNRHWRA